MKRNGEGEEGRKRMKRSVRSPNTFLFRVSYRGGGAGNFPPPTTISPLEILKLSMVTIALSQILNNNLVPDSVRSNLRVSKFEIFLGACPTRLHMHECAFVRYYRHATILFPPPTQNPA